MSSAASPAGKPLLGNRWTQLFIGIACMALVANLQYAWTLFVVPMKTQNLWSAAEVQTAFSIFILVETWLVPVEGWLVDRFGPRPVVMAGAVFVALSWVIDSFATTLPMLYAASVIAGLGAGCVYGTCVGNALKWFPDRRGLAAGLTAAGFGAGAALTVIPIANMIHDSGYRHTFFVFGVIQGIAIFILGIALIRPNPGPGIKPVARVVMSKVDYSPGQMVKTPLFWMIYLLFVLVAAGGLIATAQLGPIAKSFGFAKLPVQFLGATLPLLTLALSVDNLLNGLTRPICGLLSDKIGRENTMLIVFVGEGLALLGMNAYGHDPYAFLIFAPLIFLCWGEIFSIFPAICADTFGSKYAASNAGTLYTAKGTASLLVPIASLVAAGGSWEHVLIGSAVVSIVAGVSAKFILAPMRKRWFSGMSEEVAPVLQAQ
ncbi:Oxalate:formate antiporter [Paraburkholderia caffeinitolerans]|uniref:Oxalate:formate antiporter n=1 Tax=Paraburkholderia caffeinitolerans TaxID=1723730 RepID=A0A6J5FS21_9BURK|nr:oxalate/formate MFS antiporter [Paraburkholderia caffeinitolerans]CAB3785847.1 Oxalate:formate antiporter [Paraburkholderia caffeinitolerans]